MSETLTGKATKGAMPSARQTGAAMPFTAAEIGHMLTLLQWAQESGEYYGNREQFNARTIRLIAKLEAELPRQQEPQP